MVTIAVGCMIGGPMSPTGGARNALMIGFLGIGNDISFMGWIMGFMYTLLMSAVMAFLLPFLFKPEVNDLSDAVGLLKRFRKTWCNDYPTKNCFISYGSGVFFG